MMVSRTHALVEKKYYMIEGLLKAICDGNEQKATWYLEQILSVIAESELSERFLQIKKTATELNILLRYKSHFFKVNPLTCEETSKMFEVQIDSCKTYSSLEIILQEMVASYIALIRLHSRRQHSNLIRNCIDYIDSHYAQPLSLGEEAQRLNVSASYLSHRFVQETGMSFKTYVNLIRIQSACHLLENLQLPIQRVSEYCGFSNSNYFSRIFRKMKGMTPREYRLKKQIPDLH